MIRKVGWDVNSQVMLELLQRLDGVALSLCHLPAEGLDELLRLGILVHQLLLYSGRFLGPVHVIG